MKFTCQRSLLLEALSALASVIPARSTKPILQNICLQGCAESNTVEFSATDLDVGLRFVIEPNSLEDPGAVVLPAMEFTSIVRDAWGEILSVVIKNCRAHIEADGAQFDIPGEAADDFPEMPALADGQSLSLRAEDLQTAIAQTLFATAREEQQYALAGVYVQLRDKEVELVTTDTFRLALATRPLQEASDQPQQAIVLAKGMQELSKLLGKEEVVHIQLSESHFFAQTSRAILISRLIEGKFPQYQAILPKDLDKTVTVDRTRLIEALKQAAHVANPETRAISLVAHAGSLELKASCAQAGEAQIVLDAVTEGGEVAVNFNYAYLLDVCKVLSGDSVTLQLRDREAPGRIDIKGYTYLLSPVYAQAGA